MGVRLFRKAFIGLLLAAHTAAAQAPAPATPEPAPKSAAESATWRYQTQLTGVYTSGAVERTLLTSSQSLTWAQGRHFGTPLAATFSYGRQNARLRERELLVSLNPYYRLGRFRAYALSTYERSNLRGIRYRVQAGAGPGWALLRDEDEGREVLVSNMILHESTRFTDGSARNVVRSSTRLKLAYRWGLLTLGSNTFYQPALNARADYRIANTTTARLSLTARLAFTAAYTYTYEQRVIEQKSRGNTNITVGVSYSNGP